MAKTVKLSFRVLSIEGVTEHFMDMDSAEGTLAVPITEYQFKHYMNFYDFRILPDTVNAVSASQKIYRTIKGE
jgi:hypothetical protein